MPARDKIHDAVKNALTNDGWTITADPYVILYKDARLPADLAAEKTLAAERRGRKIVVEIKTFAGPSPLHDFEVALGQFSFYRHLLSLTAPESKLYLAVSSLAFDHIFSRPSVQSTVDQLQLPLLIVDVAKEEVVRWTN